MKRVQRAVITAAGRGTRQYPASSAVPKEMFPLVDRDGLTKPVIQILVEEAVAAGIERICLVTQPGDEAVYRRYFRRPEGSLREALARKPAALAAGERLQDLGERLSFVAQTAPEGYGHAVFQARDFVDDEPFLLMLGDHLYHSYGTRTCSKQLVDAFNRHGKSVVGLQRTPEDELATVGTATGVWIEPDELLSITEFAEKPTRDYARSNLQVPGLPDDTYLTVFGQYIIKPQVFDYLGEHIENNVRERGEFQLTSALDRLRREDGFLGLVVDGRRFDIGMPEYYLETLRTFRS